MKRYLILIFMVMNLTGISQNLKFAGTVELNGLGTYYEVYGNGPPLFLLHGFSQSSSYWHPHISEYSDKYEVYLVDLMGHGKSDPFKTKISLKAVAQNLSDLIIHLKLQRINAIGYSYGGETLFQLALLNPVLIESMIIIGSCGTWDVKDFPEFINAVKPTSLFSLWDVRHI
jgi:pimeloyl-ACP methyl ester carboxylesterase